MTKRPHRQLFSIRPGTVLIVLIVMVVLGATVAVAIKFPLVVLAILGLVVLAVIECSLHGAFEAVNEAARRRQATRRRQEDLHRRRSSRARKQRKPGNA